MPGTCFLTNATCTVRKCAPYYFVRRRLFQTHGTYKTHSTYLQATGLANGYQDLCKRWGRFDRANLALSMLMNKEKRHTHEQQGACPSDDMLPSTDALSLDRARLSCSVPVTNAQKLTYCQSRVYRMQARKRTPAFCSPQEQKCPIKPVLHGNHLSYSCHLHEGSRDDVYEYISTVQHSLAENVAKLANLFLSQSHLASQSVHSRSGTWAYPAKGAREERKS